MCIRDSNKDSQTVEAGAGSDGTACMVLKNKGDGNAWEAQCAYSLSDFLQAGKTYMIKFKAKSTSGAGHLQFQYQNGTTYGSQGGYLSLIHIYWRVVPCKSVVISDYPEDEETAK